jgi:hypothetical protein
MQNYQTINESIASRQPATSFEDNTYYTNDLWTHFCTHKDYKYVTIFGYYKDKYDWTDAEALEMYNKSPDNWTDGLGVVRLYDWGKGDNQIELEHADREWHLPELDHIISKDEAKRLGWTQKQIDHPSNFQVLAKIVNRVKNNLTKETALAVLPLIVDQFNRE